MTVLIWHTMQDTGTHKRIKKPFPVPRQPLISSDGNQATNSTVIIIHVVNHLFLQKNYFPYCPTLPSFQT